MFVLFGANGQLEVQLISTHGLDEISNLQYSLMVDMVTLSINK